MDIIAFKIWYSNSVFESKTGSYADWLNSPVDDIQAVVFYFAQKDGMGRHTRRMMRGNDYYGWDGKELSEHFDDITKVSGEVKYGKWTGWENHVRIADEALADYGEGWLWHSEKKQPTELELIKRDI